MLLNTQNSILQGNGFVGAIMAIENQLQSLKILDKLPKHDIRLLASIQADSVYRFGSHNLKIAFFHITSSLSLDRGFESHCSLVGHVPESSDGA